MMPQPTPIETPTRRQRSGKRLTLRLDSDILEAVRELARDQERSVAAQIRFILKRVAEDPELFENR